MMFILLCAYSASDKYCNHLSNREKDRNICLVNNDSCFQKRINENNDKFDL